jgi:hypothetical protein
MPRYIVERSFLVGFEIPPSEADVLVEPFLARGAAGAPGADRNDAGAQSRPSPAGVPASPANSGRHGGHAAAVLVSSRKRTQTLRRDIGNDRETP